MIDTILRSRLFKKLPRSVRHGFGYTVSYCRRFWWGVVRSESAQRDKIFSDELEWSGKIMHPDDLDELIEDQRPRWRRWDTEKKKCMDRRVL